MSINQQKPLPTDTSGRVTIHSMWKTIQGEGPFVGCPAFFVRLHGCNLMCPNCDTLYLAPEAESESPSDAADKILEQLDWFTNAPVNEAGSRMPALIVFTGGEPFRQTGFTELLRLLHDRAAIRHVQVKVQVETNGTIYPAGFPRLPFGWCSIVISPKNNHVANEWLISSLETHWKYVAKHDGISIKDGLPTSVLGYGIAPTRPPASAVINGRVYLQPEDCKDDADNKLNEQAVVESCMDFGYRFTPQLHKQLGLP